MTADKKQRLTWLGKFIHNSLTWAFRLLMTWVVTKQLIPLVEKDWKQSVSNGDDIKDLKFAYMKHLESDSLNDISQQQVNFNFANFISDQRQKNKDIDKQADETEKHVDRVENIIFSQIKKQ